MTATRTASRFAKFALAAPLALALAACNGAEEEEGGAIVGDPIAEIPAPEGSSWIETAAKTEEGGFKIGNPDAPLKLVEYASHTCPACASFAANGKGPLKEYVETGVVSFEQREVFLNTFDVVIASIAQCGPPQRMQPLSDEVWSNLGEVMQGWQQNTEAVNASGELPLDQRFLRLAEIAGLIDFAAARGVSADEARSCLTDDEKIVAMEAAAREQTEQDNVTGTPTFFLNGQRVDGISWDVIEPALQRAGARKE